MKKLVCYLTAGFPDISFCEELIATMSQNGVDCVELGIPFSDPMADGNIIAKANKQALKNGFDFANVAKIAKTAQHFVNVFVMSYANPLYHHRLDLLFESFAKNGVKGVIIPDVPFEETRNFAYFAHRQNLAIVPFIAPTTSFERMQMLLKNIDTSPDSAGFIYLVAYTGITGANKDSNLSGLIAQIRACSKTPIFVGFGVNASNAKERAKDADGVIIGSAIVEILLQDIGYKDKINKICSLCKNIKDSINP